MRRRGFRATISALVFTAGLALVLLGPVRADAAETASGKPGESFTVTLSGAKAGRAVTAELAGSTAKATADRSGRARLKITVPDVEAGEYTMRITGGLTEDVRFRVLHKPEADDGATIAPPSTQAAPEAATRPAAETSTGIKNPASLVAGVGLVVGGIAALTVINARVRSRRRRFAPVGFG